jgi:hypothetical protein
MLTAKYVKSECLKFDWYLYTSCTLDIRGSHCIAEDLSVPGYDTVWIDIVAELH